MRTLCFALLACCGPLAAAQSVGSGTLAGPAARATSRCGPRVGPLLSFRAEVDLGPHAACSVGGAQPFGAAWTPDGERLYASLFGGLIGSGGCTVARLDPVSFRVLSTITTGESPEELAFACWPDGSLRFGFVTNSSSSTVTVFDASDSVVQTIAIPYDTAATYPTAFPFGLAVSEDGARVWVGTQDGQGFVHAIDVASLSLVPSERVELGARHSAGRLIVHEGRLVIPATEQLPGFVGSTAKLCVVDPERPFVVDELVLASSASGLRWPSLQEVAVDCDGRVWAAGFDLGARVFVIAPFAAGGPALLRRVPTGTSQPDGKFQALGLSPDGLLGVADLWTNDISWIDTRRDRVLRVEHADDYPGHFRAPHELAFSPDGATAVTTWAASDNLLVLEL